MSKQVIVYSADGCVECTYVKQMLENEGIAFEVRDVLKNREYQKEVEKFGFMGIPVTVLGDRAVKGFNPELKEIVELAKG
ncbi:glutaredoxin family protein [Halalkalibacter sp. APA_J-10(15)]|uniref:glutaredoxin family protein n=1 Tax=unclassified Halalkalibacter TaxID=2893063 RepID=UPI001FF52157|nr:glutaredoxin family protein [Halalkalibacter sp. APA_J-10(15)]MCK0472277.1 glutaredoxin family protein [Halalkalibacter sp. APA_J-10(15)]